MKIIEYKCSWCGATATRAITSGRPAPGSCLRKGKTKEGMTKPHTWVKSRTIGK